MVSVIITATLVLSKTRDIFGGIGCGVTNVTGLRSTQDELYLFFADKYQSIDR